MTSPSPENREEVPQFVEDMHKLAAEMAGKPYGLTADQVNELLNRVHEILNTLNLQMMGAQRNAAEKQVAHMREMWETSEGQSAEEEDADLEVPPDDPEDVLPNSPKIIEPDPLPDDGVVRSSQWPLGIRPEPDEGEPGDDESDQPMSNVVVEPETEDERTSGYPAGYPGVVRRSTQIPEPRKKDM